MVTIIISVNPKMSDTLYFNMHRLLARETRMLIEAGMPTLTILETLPAHIPSGSPHPVRAKCLQRHRQDTVNFCVPQSFCLKDDYVLFVDADIVNMTEGLLLSLVKTCRDAPVGSIVAPVVLLEQHAGIRANRWYDTAGFIHNNRRATLYPPWFPSEVFMTEQIRDNPKAAGDWTFTEETVVELNGSVGCVYCVNGPVFLNGGFNGEFNEQFTEHWALCKNAKDMGGKLLVRMDLIATHAYLPKYGEAFH